jgi:MFS transporter, PAT family, beta-lactamase induction signal transducer AmpG
VVIVAPPGYHNFFLITALLGVPTLLLIALHWFQESRREGPTPTPAPEPVPTQVAEES